MEYAGVKRSAAAVVGARAICAARPISGVLGCLGSGGERGEGGAVERGRLALEWQEGSELVDMASRARANGLSCNGNAVVK